MFEDFRSVSAPLVGNLEQISPFAAIPKDRWFDPGEEKPIAFPIVT